MSFHQHIQVLEVYKTVDLLTFEAPADWAIVVLEVYKTVDLLTSNLNQ